MAKAKFLHYLYIQTTSYLTFILDITYLSAGLSLVEKNQAGLKIMGQVFCGVSPQFSLLFAMQNLMGFFTPKAKGNFL